MAIPAPQISSKVTQTLSLSTPLALHSKTCVGWEAFCHLQHVDTAAFMCSSEVSIEPIQRRCVNACGSQCTALTCGWRILPFNIILRDVLFNPWLTQVCIYFVYLNKAFFSFPRPALGAAYGTAKSGTGIAAMSVMRPELIMKSIIPVVMAGIIAIYGLVVAVLIANNIVANLELHKWVLFTTCESTLSVLILFFLGLFTFNSRSLETKSNKKR